MRMDAAIPYCGIAAYKTTPSTNSTPKRKIMQCGQLVLTRTRRANVA